MALKLSKWVKKKKKSQKFKDEDENEEDFSLRKSDSCLLYFHGVSMKTTGEEKWRKQYF